MNRLKLICCILFIFVFFTDVCATKEDINIGFVYDGQTASTDENILSFENELKTLLGSKYNINIPEEKILNAEWSASQADAYYHQLVNDKEVNIIIGFGIITASVLAQKSKYPKPTIVLGIINPEFYNIAPRTQNFSGIHNLTYLLFNLSVTRDLDAFYGVYPYKTVGFIFSEELQKIRPISSIDFKQVMEKNNTNLITIPIAENIDIIDNIRESLTGVDAVYLGYFGKYEGLEKQQLIDELISKGIPSFGMFASDVEMGALVAMSPDLNFSKVSRRIGLDIEAILEGEDPSGLPVHISFEEKLALNMDTARKINFSPKFTILSQAELINEDEPAIDRELDLQDVMQEAIEFALELKIEDETLKSAQKVVSLARTNFLPSLNINATGVQIDEERAQASFGQQAERTFSGSASITQLLFSEQALGNLTIQKHLLKGSEYGYDQLKLDVALDAATAYFNVLRAETVRKIQKNNMELIKQNLEISKRREAVGYSGSSDVYRWESLLASSSVDFLSAQNSVKLTKIQLNRLLNRPLDELFTISEAELSDSLYDAYLLKARDYIDNPRSLKIFANFLIEESIRNSPEIRKLDAGIAAKERSLASSKLKRFVPTVGLNLEAEHIFSRAGAGSDLPGVDPIDNTWNVGLNANLPLFQGGATGIDIQQKKIEIRKLHKQRVQILQYLEFNVRSVILDAAVKGANLYSSKRSAEFADKSLTLVQDAYAHGKVSIVELIDAQNAALTAESVTLNSVYEFMSSMFKVERAIGKFSLLSTKEERDEFNKRLIDFLGND